MIKLFWNTQNQKKTNSEDEKIIEQHDRNYSWGIYHKKNSNKWIYEILKKIDYKIIENDTSIGDFTVRGFDSHETALMSARTNNIQHDGIPFFHDVLNIMNEDGTMNENVPSSYQNLDRFETRKKTWRTGPANGPARRAPSDAQYFSHGRSVGPVAFFQCG